MIKSLNGIIRRFGKIDAGKRHQDSRDKWSKCKFVLYLIWSLKSLYPVPLQTGQCGKYVDVLLLESSYPHNIFFIALSTKIMRHVEFELTAGFGNVVGEVHGA